MMRRLLADRMAGATGNIIVTITPSGRSASAQHRNEADSSRSLLTILTLCPWGLTASGERERAYREAVARRHSRAPIFPYAANARAAAPAWEKTNRQRFAAV